MKSLWLSPARLAELPTMPNSKRLVNLMISRDGDWESRDRVGRGGGKEYLIPDRYLTEELLGALRQRFPDEFGFEKLALPPTEQESLVPPQNAVLTAAPSLPKFAEDGGVFDDPSPIAPSAAIADLSSVSAIADVPKPTGFIEPQAVDDRDRIAQARAEILSLLKKWLPTCKQGGRDQVACEIAFAEQLKTGSIQFPDHVYRVPDWALAAISTKEGRLKVCRATFKNWEKQSLLAPKHKGREGQGFFDLRPDYATACKAVIAGWGERATASLIHHLFVSEQIRGVWDIAPAQIEKPTLSQVRAWLEGFKRNEPALYKRLSTGDRNATRAFFGSLSDGLEPNAVWQIDSTLADLSVRGETKIERYAVVGLVDVCTRRRCFLVSKTSKSEAILMLLYKAILDWGVPKAVRTDNGKDYVSAWVKSALAALRIEHQICTPFSPWEKGQVERSMRILQHSHEFTLLPFTTGSNVAERQRIRKRGETLAAEAIALSPQQFQDWLDRWCDRYNAAPDSLGGSPIQRVAKWGSEGWQPAVVSNPAILQWLLRKEELVKVNAKGIRIGNRWYVAPELGAWVGKQVAVRFDPKEFESISVYDSPDLETANFICKAVWSQSEGLNLAELSAKAKAAGAEIDAHVKQVNKRARRLKARIAENPELLAEQGSRVVPLLQTRDHELPSLAEVAIRAVATKPTTTDDIKAEIDARWEREMPKPEPEPEFDFVIRTPQDWLHWWDNPQDASVADLEWMQRTANLTGYGQAWLVMRGLDLDEVLAELEQRKSRAA